MTSDRPAHCAETSRADAAHVGCAHATEVCAFPAELRGAHAAEMAYVTHSTEMRAAKAADMAAAKTAAHCADMTTAEATAKTAVTSAAETTATASVSGASCGKSEHYDRCCCSEKLRHDESPGLVVVVRWGDAAMFECSLLPSAFCSDVVSLRFLPR
jgi:hypothetical protein